MNEAEKWAAELAESEGKAFEKALSQTKDIDLAAENRELKHLLRAIRNFYGSTESWQELYEADVTKLIGGADNEPV